MRVVPLVEILSYFPVGRVYRGNVAAVRSRQRAYWDVAMTIKVREVIRLLEKHGWVEMRSKGRHRHFKQTGRAFIITRPGNEGRELAPSTLSARLKKAGLK